MAYLTVNALVSGVIDPATGLPASTASTASAANLPDTAQVWRRPDNQADEGGVDEGLTSSNDLALIGTWRCLIEKPSTFAESMRGEVEQATSRYWGRFEIGADVRPTDEIRANGARFEVVDTDAGISSPLHLSAVLVKVT